MTYKVLKSQSIWDYKIIQTIVEGNYIYSLYQWYMYCGNGFQMSNHKYYIQ